MHILTGQLHLWALSLLSDPSLPSDLLLLSDLLGPLPLLAPLRPSDLSDPLRPSDPLHLSDLLGPLHLSAQSDRLDLLLRSDPLPLLAPSGLSLLRPALSALSDRSVPWAPFSHAALSARRAGDSPDSSMTAPAFQRTALPELFCF